MTAKLNLTDLEKTRLVLIQESIRTCADCGTTQPAKKHQIRKVRQKNGVMQFYPSKYCTKCENRGKVIKRRTRDKKSAQYGPAPGTATHIFMCRVPLVPMSAQIRQDRRLG